MWSERVDIGRWSILFRSYVVAKRGLSAEGITVAHTGLRPIERTKF